MKLNINPEWLLEAAENEEGGIVSVGGLAFRAQGEFKAAGTPGPERTALAHLLELQRRNMRLSVESLASQSDVEVEEILEVEQGHGVPEPRTLFKLAQVLKLRDDKLMHLAGHVSRPDPRLEQAAVRFAARSAPMDLLTAEEAAALAEFVKELAD